MSGTRCSPVGWTGGYPTVRATGRIPPCLPPRSYWALLVRVTTARAIAICKINYILIVVVLWFIFWLPITAHCNPKLWSNNRWPWFTRQCNKWSQRQAPGLFPFPCTRLVSGMCPAHLLYTGSASFIDHKFKCLLSQFTIEWRIWRTYTSKWHIPLRLLAHSGSPLKTSQ